MINKQRIREDFLQLTLFDSVSFSERKTADWIMEQLNLLGFEAEEDNAGRIYGGTAGNIYGFLKGELPGSPILLSAHMDVVQPGIGKTAVVHEDGRITSNGDTVLGSDDICGIVEILNGVRHVVQEGLPHRDIEVLFSAGEEVYGKGAAVFDYSKIRAKEAYVLDLSGPVGTAAIQAPSIISFGITMKGKASHAGFEPEKGIHAITFMSAFIQSIQQGHLDEETTLNIGTIAGGTATNIVPESCVCAGEIRSFSHDKALHCVEDLQQKLSDIAAVSGVETAVSTELHMQAYRIAESDSVVKRFQEACRRLGMEGAVTGTFGGSDNNHFVSHGLHGIVLSCGMYQVHSVKEYTTIDDLEKGALLIAQLLQ